VWRLASGHQAERGPRLRIDPILVAVEDRVEVGPPDLAYEYEKMAAHPRPVLGASRLRAVRPSLIARCARSGRGRARAALAHGEQVRQRFGGSAFGLWARESTASAVESQVPR
jgi:hypothetical protein